MLVWQNHCRRIFMMIRYTIMYVQCIMNSSGSRWLVCSTQKMQNSKKKMPNKRRKREREKKKTNPRFIAHLVRYILLDLIMCALCERIRLPSLLHCGPWRVLVKNTQNTHIVVVAIYAYWLVSCCATEREMHKRRDAQTEKEIEWSHSVICVLQPRAVKAQTQNLASRALANMHTHSLPSTNLPVLDLNAISSCSSAL